METMKYSLRLEEAAMLAISLYAFNTTGFAWWIWFALILAPDLGMLGYLFSTRSGAVMYNVLHHKAIAILLFWYGLYTGNSWLELAGIIMFGHSSLDRMLGYGLKYSDSFQHTHLGWIGAKRQQEIQ